MRSLHATVPSLTPASLSGGDVPDLPRLSEDDREWTIGEMAKAFSLTLRALRFYESRGLIAPRRFGGARYYTARDRARLKLILAAKQMGFTLSETASMIGRSSDGATGDLPLSAEAMQTQIQFLEEQKSSIDDALTLLRQRLGDMRA